MMDAVVDGGSFRDPAGRIFRAGNRIFRTVMPFNAADYEGIRDEGLLDALVRDGLVIGAREADPNILGTAGQGSRYVLEHPRIPFLSYPYEWGFAMHKRAALHHLEVHLRALDAGFTLADATAYNIQFIGLRPVFIDHLSFRKYREGEVWAGHRQFCMQFLNPLICWADLGMQPNHWFRGSLEGIAPEDLARLLGWRHNLSWTVLTHVTAQAALQRRSQRAGTIVRRAEQRLPRVALRGMLEGLRRYIGGLALPKGATVWQDYAADNSYAEAEAEAKRRFVGEMVEKTRPALLFDLGCNSGDYSQVALAAGAGMVVGFDFDHGALDHAFHRFDASGGAFLPLWLDAANPSPSQGWAQSERKGMAERAKADALIALAFIHHIAIGRNVPLDMAIDWIVDRATAGVIEFPSKSDPMVQRLLAQRDDIFPDYTEADFLALLGKRARIVRTEHLSKGGRLLAWYDRSE